MSYFTCFVQLLRSEFQNPENNTHPLNRPINKEMKEKKTYIHYISYTMPKINKIVPQDYDI